MQLNNTTVITPYDNPVQYDPAWRNVIAVEWAENERLRLDHEYAPYLRDPWIRRRKDYLVKVKNRRRLSKDDHAIRLASTWYQGSRQSDIKARLEPLLLTPIGFDIINLDIGTELVPPETFKAYERLFFSVRQADGRQSRSCQLRQYFAMPDGKLDRKTDDTEIWKIVGALLGYDTLVNMWLWVDAHGIQNTSKEFMFDEMWRVAQSQIFTGMIAGRIGMEPLSKMLSSFTAQVRMTRETGSTTQQGVEMGRALMTLLGMMMPEVINTAKDVDTNNEQITASIRNRLAAQKTISSQGIVDAGKEIGEETLNAHIQSHFVTAPEAAPTAAMVFG